MSEIAEMTGKRVMVLETSWAYTLDDGDGSGNTVSHESNSANPFYSFSVQGQADEIASVTGAIADVGDAALGMMYWEPAWIPVPGSGWATPASLDYIHDKGPCGNEWANLRCG